MKQESTDRIGGPVGSSSPCAADEPMLAPTTNTIHRLRAHVDAGDRYWFARHPGVTVRDRMAIPDEFAPGLPEHPRYRVQVEFLPDGRLLRCYYCPGWEGVA